MPCQRLSFARFTILCLQPRRVLISSPEIQIRMHSCPCPGCSNERAGILPNKCGEVLGCFAGALRNVCLSVLSTVLLFIVFVRIAVCVASLQTCKKKVDGQRQHSRIPHDAKARWQCDDCKETALAFCRPAPWLPVNFPPLLPNCAQRNYVTWFTFGQSRMESAMMKPNALPKYGSHLRDLASCRFALTFAVRRLDTLDATLFI